MIGETFPDTEKMGKKEEEKKKKKRKKKQKTNKSHPFSDWDYHSGNPVMKPDTGDPAAW